MVVEYATAIEGATIKLGTNIAPNTINISQQKTMPYLHAPHFIQF